MNTIRPTIAAKMEERPMSVKQAFANLNTEETQKQLNKELEQQKYENSVAEAYKRFETQVKPLLERRVLEVWNNPIVVFLKETSEEMAQMIEALEESKRYGIQYRTWFNLPDSNKSVFDFTQGCPLRGQEIGWDGRDSSFTGEKGLGESVLALESKGVKADDLGCELWITYHGAPGSSGADGFGFGFSYEPRAKQVKFEGKEYDLREWPKATEDLIKDLAAFLKNKEFYFWDEPEWEVAGGIS